MSVADVARLSRALVDCQQPLSAVDRYYTGNQPLGFLSQEVRRAVGDRLTSLVINWPRVIVDSIEERLDVEGFRLAADQPADSELWRIWQANNLDEWSQLGHIDALVHGRSYAVVWANDDDPETPQISVESAHQMAVEYEPGTRKIRQALKQYRDGDTVTAILLLSDRIEKYKGRASVADPATLEIDAAGLTLVETLDNPLGRPPVVAFVNRPRLLNWHGESELSDVIPLADAINKLGTDMMVTSEFHAEPRRWATGMQIPQPTPGAGDGERQRFHEQVRQQWDQATTGKTWIAGQGVNFGQFSAADLSNFVQAIGMLTAQVAAIAGLPPHYLGINTDNPASADAIRSAEASLVKRAQRKMRGWGGAWEQVMRLAQQVRDGKPDPALESLETIWRDPETPTLAQKADAVTKLLAGDRPVIDVDQAREDLGYTPVQIARMNQRAEDAADAAVTADVRARLDLAKQLQAEQGLSPAASFAAVGLLQAAGQMAADMGVTPA